MPLTVTDARGKAHTFAEPPQRIVSLVPSDTYTIARLGASDRLVGRTRYCVAPAEALAHVATVGGVRDPDVAAIMALEPDVVIANREDNDKAHVARLEAAGVPVLVSHPTTALAGLEHAGQLARLLPDRAGHAEAVLRAARQRVERPPEAPAAPVRTFVPIWLDPLMAVGPGSFAADILRRVGAEDVVAHHRSAAQAGAVSYPRVRASDVRARRPELVLLPDEPYAFSDADAEHFRALGHVGSAPYPVAVRRCDGKDLFWYGLRALEGLDRLRTLLDEVRAGLSTARNR